MGYQEYWDSLLVKFKSRTVPTFTFVGKSSQVLLGNILWSTQAMTADGWYQETTSLENTGWKQFIRLGARDVGGPFFTRRVTLTSQNHVVELGTDRPGAYGNNYYLSGPVYPGVVQPIAKDIFLGRKSTTPVWSSDKALSRADLRAEGLKLMLSAVPTTPAFSAANALGELISEGQFFGIPFKDALRTNDDAGVMAGNYLNLQFGILPVLSDAQGLIAAFKDSEAIMAQFRKDANKIVTRRRQKPLVVTNEQQTLPAPYVLVDASNSAVISYLQRGTTGLDIRTHTERDIWFEGAFQYYIPPNAESWYKRLREINAVYGALPTPETLWELTPFSWLADWFTNAQDTVRAAFLAGTDGSTLVRGYVMCRTHIRTEYTFSGDLRVNGEWKTHNMSWTVTEVIKQRERARSYGIDWSGLELSPKQVSILTALGLSRRG